jgi:hypothetical protein
MAVQKLAIYLLIRTGLKRRLEPSGARHWKTSSSPLRAMLNAEVDDGKLSGKPAARLGRFSRAPERQMGTRARTAYDARLEPCTRVGRRGGGSKSNRRTGPLATSAGPRRISVTEGGAVDGD